MYPADILRDFFLDNKDTMTFNLIARVLKGVYDKGDLEIIVRELDRDATTPYIPE